MNIINNDRLDAMILLSAHVLAEKNEAELMAVDSTNIEIPASLNRRIKRMISCECFKHEHGKILTIAKRVAALVLIACTAAFTFVMSVEAVRETLWHTIVEFFEDYISVTYIAEDNPPKIIINKKEPTAIPNDWGHKVKIDSQSMYYIQYSINNEVVISFKQMPLNGEDDWIDNENAIINNIYINGNEGVFITLLDKKLCHLMWNDGLYAYIISYDNSKIEHEFGICIAESVQ